jgi:hypothetical protein
MIKKKSVVVEDMKPVETLADEMDLATWEKAGLMQAAGWSPGKQVTEATFVTALNNFRSRPQGGGRIQV